MREGGKLDLLFYSFMQSLVDSSKRPDWGSNSTLVYWDDTLTNLVSYLARAVKFILITVPRRFVLKCKKHHVSSLLKTQQVQNVIFLCVFVCFYI